MRPSSHPSTAPITRAPRALRLRPILATAAGLFVLTTLGSSAQERPASSGAAIPPTKVESAWLAKNQTFVTKLVTKGPSPQEGDTQLVPPAGAKAVVYESGALKLKAWYQAPADGKKHPALVFFHGGYALGEDDLTGLEAFRKAGFAIMTPSLRGENGNPGFHEMICGEVDDAVAAVAWVKKQAEVDPARVVTFGHSAGGVISALLSLYPDIAALTGSVGGLYGADLFEGEECPFDPQDKEEVAIRILPPHVAEMKTKHIAYVGQRDRGVQPGAKVAQEGAKAAGHNLLQIQSVAGNHFQSLEPALELFLVEAQRAVSGAKPAPPIAPGKR